MPPVIRVENLGKRYFLGEFDYNRRLRAQFATWTRGAFATLFHRNGKARQETGGRRQTRESGARRQEPDPLIPVLWLGYRAS